MKPRKILVVDDNAVIHKIYGMLLRRFPLVHANNGFDAFDRLDANPDVDVILLDINMPHMNGLEFLKVLKKTDSLRHIPVIIISIEDEEDEKNRFLKAGAAAYMEKPPNTKKLLELIDSL